MAAPPRYGMPNVEMLRTWIGRPPADDGPFWAINLMQYRAVADYGDGSGPARSGREADDEYAPVAVLADIGAVVALFGDVVPPQRGEPAWDRVAIVRYPSRASFMAMQQRDDFRAQHVHKEAGMQFTIVLAALPAALPAAGLPPNPAPEGPLVMRVVRLADGAELPASPGATRVATFTVEGVIVGDDRVWSTVAFDRCTDDATVAALLQRGIGVEDQYAMLVDAAIDNLVASITSASPGAQ